MSLLDWFRRPRDAAPPAPPSTDEWLARGRLEAEVNTLRLEWMGYKDQLNRLVQRLEKRDQRAAAREEAPAPEPEANGDGFNVVDAERKLAERKRNALLRSG